MKHLKPYIQYNGYFARHEVVLISMLGSRSKEEQEQALDIILELRKKEKRSKRKTVRRVKIPDINIRATKLAKMVDLKQASSTPPLLMKYKTEELEKFRNQPYTSALPCTTIAVERGFRLTTEAATVTNGAWAQDTVTWNIISARKKNPLRSKKCDWNC